MGSWLAQCLPYLVVTVVMWGISRVQRRMGPRIPVGDEVSYLQSAAQDDPDYPRPFLRMPFMTHLASWAGRLSADPEATLRRLTDGASWLTVLLCMLGGHIIGGPWAGLLAGLLVALSPGRIVLSRHIWPDIWLGLWLAAACLVMVWPGLSPDARALLLGLAAMQAFLTRFDAILLAPMAAWASHSPSVGDLALILLPTLVVAVLLSLRNLHRYGIALPDNTWLFNLTVAAQELDGPGRSPRRVGALVSRSLGRWSVQDQATNLDLGWRSLGRLARRAPRAALDALLRGWAALGPDSFALHRLLPPAGKAYPLIPAGLNRWLGRALVAYPTGLSALALLACWMAGAVDRSLLLLSLSLFLGSLAHLRTRYQQAWLPGLVLLTVSAFAQPQFRLATGNGSGLLVPALVCAALALVSARLLVRLRPER